MNKLVNKQINTNDINKTICYATNCRNKILAECRTQLWFEKERRLTMSSSAIKTMQFPPNLTLSVHIQTRQKKSRKYP